MMFLFPLMALGAGAVYLHFLQTEKRQSEIQRGITERAGFYPSGCPSVFNASRIVECGHNYCQLLRNARS
jgi:hypothetical protein